MFQLHLLSKHPAFKFFLFWKVLHKLNVRKNLYTILSSFIYAFRYILIDFPAYIKLVVSILNTYYIGSRQNGKSILQFHIIFFTIKLETWSILIQTCSLILPYTDFCL